MADPAGRRRPYGAPGGAAAGRARATAGGPVPRRAGRRPLRPRPRGGAQHPRPLPRGVRSGGALVRRTARQAVLHGPVGRVAVEPEPGGRARAARGVHDGPRRGGPGAGGRADPGARAGPAVPARPGGGRRGTAERCDRSRPRRGGPGPGRPGRTRRLPPAAVPQGGLRQGQRRTAAGRSAAGRPHPGSGAGRRGVRRAALVPAGPARTPGFVAALATLGDAEPGLRLFDWEWATGPPADGPADSRLLLPPGARGPRTADPADAPEPVGGGVR